MSKGAPLDPKGLMAEAYKIEGISPSECRSIFLDWALSMPQGADMRAAIESQLALYGAETAHPMTDVLKEGLGRMAAPKRRGGWRARARTN